MSPISILFIDGKAVLPLFNNAKGVALVIPSGFTYVDIIAGQEATKAALAANAGFIKFDPNPPKNSLTIIIANAAPKTAIHQGAFAGKLKANKIPVTTALKSLIRIGLLNAF